MDRLAKEEIREIVGEGKLYEIELYGKKIANIKTNERDFDFSSDLIRLLFFKEVTNSKSKVVQSIKELFGKEEVKIIAWTSYYTDFDGHENDFIFKKVKFTGKGYAEYSCVLDTDCYYIVCTPNKKGKIKKFNIPDTPEFENFEIE